MSLEWAKSVPGGWEIRIKAVPGASRSQIVGELGDRLKVQIAAPAEGGKANRAVADVLANWLRVAPSKIELRSGGSNPNKMFFVARLDLPALPKSKSE